MKLTDLLQRWRNIINGQACGCPDCIRTLLDEMGEYLQKSSK